MGEELNWTHTKVKISDIRSIPGFYNLIIDGFGKLGILTIKEEIFRERVESFLLKPMNQVSREEILKLRWNMYISKGHYIKIKKDEDIAKYIKFNKDPETNYISYLEIISENASIKNENCGEFGLSNFDIILSKENVSTIKKTLV